TGGGAWMRPENRALVAGAGVSVWLDCPLPLLWQRVRHKPTRPLLQTQDPQGTLERLLAERAPSYALAEVTIPLRAGESIETTPTRVLHAVCAHQAAPANSPVQEP